MTIKSIILSSAGLKNILVDRCDEGDQFRIIIGNKEIKLHRIFAEFISPAISHLHQCDPTINYIKFGENLNKSDSKMMKLYNDILNENTIAAITRLSQGYSFQIHESDYSNLRFLSFLLSNEELFTHINELSHTNDKDANIDEIIDEIIFYDQKMTTLMNFDYSSMIDSISKFFSSNDQQKLKKIPKPVLYKIIKNDNFKAASEDSLLDIINEVILNDSKEDDIENNDIYELVDYPKLSKNKFLDFISHYDYTKITATMWHSFIKTFSIIKDPKITEFKYDGDKSHLFSGIVSNNHESVIATASTTYKSYYPENATDFNSDNYFCSDTSNGYQFNSWLQYEFKSKKIRPTSYSIKTRNDNNKQNPINWCIEVSNTGKDNEWRVIDTRTNVTSISKSNQSDIFNIATNLHPGENYRYIRLRTTGPTSEGCCNIAISSLEYFGMLIE